MRIALLPLFLLPIGCATVQVTADLAGQSLGGERPALAHVHAQTWGVYLFNWLPILCGDPAKPGSGASVLFSDRARSEDAVRIVTEASKSLGAGATLDLYSQTGTSWVPATCFWIRRAEASGNACR
jgi:hypothetical protein